MERFFCVFVENEPSFDFCPHVNRNYCILSKEVILMHGSCSLGMGCR